MVARPGAVEGLAHSDGYQHKQSKPLDYERSDSADPSLYTPQAADVWNGYPYIQGTMSDTGEHLGYMSRDPNHMYGQGMWDPNYWWNMQNQRFQDQGIGLAAQLDTHFQ
jgi:hypothetical protein